MSAFSPSRGRAREGLLESAAVAAQRCGATLPTLLPETCSPDLVLSAAASINPFDSALFANFATAIVADTKANLSSPEDVSARRVSVSEHLAHLSRALEPFRERGWHRCHLPRLIGTCTFRCCISCLICSVSRTARYAWTYLGAC